jgi:hypothetical protein
LGLERDVWGIYDPKRSLLKNATTEKRFIGANRVVRVRANLSVGREENNKVCVEK